MRKQNNLIVLVGATGVGKTDLSIDLAKWLDAPIVSSDSRQMYRQMRIGTAVPSDEQLNTVKHYFIHNLDITEHYTSGKYEREVLQLLDELFAQHRNVMLVGGSGLYIDAVCNGMDAVPPTNLKLREQLTQRLESEGIESLLSELKEKDPVYYQSVDKDNPNRVTRALEVIIESGKTYSSFRQGRGKQRNFNIIKIGVQREREELYKRINMRVDMMMQEGLLEEATALYPLREYNALQTVGYREFFDYLDGKTTLDQAVELLKRNTRRYAKRQTTWFGRYDDVAWFSPDDIDNIKKYLSSKIDTVEYCCNTFASFGVKEVLLEIQKQIGYIDATMQQNVAEKLDIPLIQIENIVRFNGDLTDRPQAKHNIKVCCGKYCSVSGAKELIGYIEQYLGVKNGETTSDNLYSLDVCECQGNCAAGIIIWVDDTKYENVNIEKLSQILQEII